jgi:tRNA threonylcarbamoyladenosine biosynthesis protein TsaE
MLSIQKTAENSLEIDVESEEDTFALGQRLAAILIPGQTIALIGDLGAGKTRLVKALAAALGVPEDEVSSPTFTLVQEYSGRIPLRHCDTYRLRNPDEFLDLGTDELFAPDGIALVEWADRVEHFLPRDVLRIDIRILSPTARRFGITATGRTSGLSIEKLTAGFD